MRGPAGRSWAEQPSAACAVLEAVWERWATDEFGDSTAGDVAKAALAVIDRAPDVALMSCGCLCEQAMTKVLSSECISADEVCLFTALQRWIAVDGEERKVAAARLVPCLSLELMPPTFVADVVAKSGLVSNEILLDVFRGHAVQAENDHGFSSRARDDRMVPNWRSSDSVEFTCNTKGEHCVELLDRSLDRGCWTWDLRVEKMCRMFGVGLVTGDVVSTEWLAKQKNRYVYHNSGYCFRSDGVHVASRPTGQKFAKGDTIHLALDCDVGILTVSISDGALVELFVGI